jgi:hypothetical protein
MAIIAPAFPLRKCREEKRLLRLNAKGLASLLATLVRLDIFQVGEFLLSERTAKPRRFGFLRSFCGCALLMADISRVFHLPLTLSKRLGRSSLQVEWPDMNARGTSFPSPVRWSAMFSRHSARIILAPNAYVSGYDITLRETVWS